MSRLALVIAALAGSALAACGDRVFTHPPTWPQTIGFPSQYEPINLNDLIRRHPELDGIVMLAPTYNEILERDMAARRSRGEAAVPDYRIAAGTSFAVDVAGEPQLSRTYIVGPQGYIDVPYVGEVVVVNRTIREVRDEIVGKLHQYYRDPKVTVNPIAISVLGGGGVGRPRAGSIAVIGPGGGAGNLDFIGDETIIKLLATSGFPANADWRQVRVLQRPDASRGRPRGRIIVVDVVAFVFGDFRQDFPMQADDVVVVPMKWSWWEQFDNGWGHMLKFLNGPLQIDGLRKAYEVGFMK